MTYSEIIMHALSFAIGGFALSLLFQPGELLDWWPRLVDWMTRRLPARIKEYVINPLYDCATCMSGQLALWISLFWLHAGLATFAVIAYTIVFSYLIGKIQSALNIWM